MDHAQKTSTWFAFSTFPLPLRRAKGLPAQMGEPGVLRKIAVTDGKSLAYSSGAM
jgi:hypothetical protein